MNEIMKAFGAVDAVYKEIAKIGNIEAFAAFIGTVVDQWIADHDLPWEAGDDILNMVLTVRDDVYDAVGTMEKSGLTT